MIRKYLSKTIFLLLFSVFSAKAAVPYGSLMLPVQFIVENGDYFNSMIDVRKNGETVFSRNGQKNMRLKLEYGNEYLLSFSKPGYITKKIKVNTTVAAEHGKQGFEPYKIGVRLYKQYEGVNTVVYNQPVAFVRYQADVDAFGYDVDYTKSILSLLTETENKLEQKAREEREMLKIQAQQSTQIKSSQTSDVSNVKTPVKENKIQNQTIIPTNKTTTASPEQFADKPIPAIPVAGEDIKNPNQPVRGNDLLAQTRPVSGSEKNKTSIRSSGGDTIRFSSETDPDKIPIVYVNRKTETQLGINSLLPENNTENLATLKNNTNGKDVPKSGLSLAAGAEQKAITSQKTSSINRVIEKTVESNRVITTIRIEEGDHITEYRRVKYNWGGEYFFVNNSSPISGHLFDLYMNGGEKK